MTLTDAERDWLAIYRRTPEIAAFFAARLTGTIALNVSQGVYGSADLRTHATPQA